MMKMKSLIAGLLLMASVMPAAVGASTPESPLVPFKANFSMDRKGLGSGRLVFALEKAADGGYVYSSELHPIGLASLFIKLVTQASEFQVVDGQLRAGTYVFKQTGGQTDSETIKFDWDKKVGIVDRDGKPRRKTAITPGVSDTQLINLVVAADVAAGKLAPQYRFLDHSKISTYTAKVLADAKLTLGKVSYDTKVVELSDTSGDGTVTVWLAPELHYLPVQIHNVDSKNDITMTMQDITLGDAAPAAVTKAGK
jgi:hypothetical protein